MVIHYFLSPQNAILPRGNVGSGGWRHTHFRHKFKRPAAGQ
jgi:hypothetical protein